MTVERPSFQREVARTKRAASKFGVEGLHPSEIHRFCLPKEGLPLVSTLFTRPFQTIHILHRDLDSVLRRGLLLLDLSLTLAAHPEALELTPRTQIPRICGWLQWTRFSRSFPSTSACEHKQRIQKVEALGVWLLPLIVSYWENSFPLIPQARATSTFAVTHTHKRPFPGSLSPHQDPPRRRTIMDPKKRSLDRRIMGGSLPFKKRCFRFTEETLSDGAPQALVSGKAVIPSSSSHELPLFSNSYVPAFADTFQKVRAHGSAFSAHFQQGGISLNEEDTFTGAVPSGCCLARSVGTVEMFCQRSPCHKGSNYCKRHYSQYVLKTDEQLPGNTMEKEAKSSSPRSTSTSSQSQQDKRYTGSPGEVRCMATTTRGRECAYIAVDGTKYCYMHEDYDTNPPPRRGGKNTTTEASKIKKTQRSGNTTINPPHKSTDRKRRSTAEKLAQKHADSPFPLLSMISSDQWANKRVRVSIGPFQGHVGTVEKWSNGWVGVRLPDVGLHNRRSFELYLESEVKTGKDLTQARSRAPLHCVSRDTVTPSPHPLDKRIPSPKASTESSTVSHQPTTPNPTMVGEAFYPGDAANTLTQLGMVSLPEVTPTECRTTVACLDSPRIESLLSAQEENPRLDLLFRTAALDRSRRSVRHPKPYEDTEMLSKKRSRNISLRLDQDSMV